MSTRIKLIWDFRGPEAEKTAAHHAIHLKEFAEREKLHYHEVSCDRYSDFHSGAYIVVNQDLMLVYRDALKPHRGTKA